MKAVQFECKGGVNKRSSKIILLLPVSIFMLTWLVGSSATSAQDQTVKWSEIIGIIEGGNLVGTGTDQARGAPGPWSATEGFALVNLDNGNLAFRVRGLVLAGGNSVGTPGPVTEVKGTLVCDADGSATGNSVLVDTDAVPLSSQGNAKFSGNVGSPPDECADEPDIAFLIRVPGFEVWIANGAVRRP